MDNCFSITKTFLNLLNIKYTAKYLKDNILSHPDYPSLLSISDTLEKYNIESLAVRIDENKLQEMPLPFIVQVEEHRGSTFFILYKVDEFSMFCYNDKNKLVKIPKEEFLKIWTGVCLLAETSNTSKEIDIEKKLVSNRILKGLKGSVAILLLSWIGFVFFNSEITTSLSSTIYTIAYFLLKLVGLAAGVLLLWFEVDQYNPTLQNFCSGGGNKINCNAVLNSKYAKLFNETLSLSIVGFSYFFATLLFLIIGSFSFKTLAILEVFSLIALPVIFVSFYYQAFVIKQWCKFCIIIQSVLVGEIIVSLFSKYYKGNLSLEAIPLVLSLLLLPILVWKILKPLLEDVEKTNLYRRGLKKIKNNPDVLEGLLLKSRKIETSTEGLGVLIPNNSAKYHVIKVCNPYCGPCAKAHPILEDLVNAGAISLQMLFTARIDGSDAKAKPVGHFLTIESQGDIKKTQQALDDWYHAELKDYDAFANKYPMNGELELQNNKIEAMRIWCDAENITHTPTIFINGYELPKEYTIEDLREVLQ